MPAAMLKLALLNSQDFLVERIAMRLGAFRHRDAVYWAWRSGRFTNKFGGVSIQLGCMRQKGLVWAVICPEQSLQGRGRDGAFVFFPLRSCTVDQCMTACGRVLSSLAEAVRKSILTKQASRLEPIDRFAFPASLQHEWVEHHGGGAPVVVRAPVEVGEWCAYQRAGGEHD